MAKLFQRKKEDFTCLNCSQKVKGNGYTDHCPECLYSLHVDINPGDREADCKKLMEPIKAELKKGKTVITYRCQCGYYHRVKKSDNDNINKIIELMRNG